MILIAGDSLTAGNIGIGFKEFLPDNSNLLRGIDGDTMRGVTTRTLRYIKQQKVRSELEGIILECGNNDVLLPYLQDSSIQVFQDAAHSLIRKGSEPIADPDEFARIYSEQLRIIIAETSSILSSPQLIGITTLPPLGEDLLHEIQGYRTAYNNHIRSIAKELSLSLIDLDSTILSLYRGAPPFTSPPYFMDVPDNFIKDARLIGSDHEAAEILTHQRGLNYTIDGLHYNAAGAQTLCIPFIHFIDTLN